MAGPEKTGSSEGPTEIPGETMAEVRQIFAEGYDAMMRDTPTHEGGNPPFQPQQPQEGETN